MQTRYVTHATDDDDFKTLDEFVDWINVNGQKIISVIHHPRLECFVLVTEARFDPKVKLTTDTDKFFPEAKSKTKAKAKPKAKPTTKPQKKK